MGSVSDAAAGKEFSDSLAEHDGDDIGDKLLQHGEDPVRVATPVYTGGAWCNGLRSRQSGRRVAVITPAAFGKLIELIQIHVRQDSGSPP